MKSEYNTYTWNDIAQSAYSLQEAADLIYKSPPLRDIRVSPKNLAPSVSSSKSIALRDTKNDVYWSMSESALRQLFLRARMPNSQDFRKGISASTLQNVLDDLFASYIQADTSRGPRRDFLIRVSEDDVCQAVLTDKYYPYDNREVSDNVSVALSSSEWEPHITHLYCDDYSLHMRINFPTLKFNDPDGKEIIPGIVVRNSEIGNGAVHCHFGILRVTGNTGMVSKQSVSAQKAYHTKQAINAAEMISASCGQIRKSVSNFVMAMVGASQKVAPKLEDAQEMHEYLGKNRVRSGEAEKIWEAYNYLPVNEGIKAGTVWTISCAVAHIAKEYDSSRRTELEILAFDMMERKF